MIGHYIGFHPSFSALMIRLVLGIIMMVHGRPKLFGSNTSGRVQMIAGVVEFIGGGFLIIGLMTRLVALLVAITICLGDLRTKLSTGFVLRPQNSGLAGYEFDLALVTMALVLVALGTGKFSLDWIAFQAW